MNLRTLRILRICGKWVIGVSILILILSEQNFREDNDQAGWALGNKIPSVDLWGDLAGAALVAESSDDPGPAG